jgi:Cof subfamily protein (haloacid dehalogenase superfamily)
VRVRLLAIDLDGTLIDDRLQMNPKDADAVRAASAAGVQIVITTGRMFRSARPYAEQLGLRGPMINYQGAVVRDLQTEEVWYRCELSVGMQQRVLAYAEPRDWHVNTYINEEVYTARARPEADLYAEVARVPYHVVGPLSKWISGDATKMVLVDLDAKAVPQRMAELSAWMDGVARVTRSLAWFVEVVNPAVSKAAALEIVTARLGIAREAVCAIGDNTNDLDMIRWAGLGVAMATAPEDVKREAGYVTGTTQDAGVAQAIERFVLGGATPAQQAADFPSRLVGEGQAGG